jgi:hypothetical protein
LDISVVKQQITSLSNNGKGAPKRLTKLNGGDQFSLALRLDHKACVTADAKGTKRGSRYVAAMRNATLL